MPFEKANLRSKTRPNDTQLNFKVKKKHWAGPRKGTDILPIADGDVVNPDQCGVLGTEYAVNRARVKNAHSTGRMIAVIKDYFCCRLGPPHIWDATVRN